MCLQGWIFAHYKQLVPRKRELDYQLADPLVDRWKPSGDFSDPGHYRSTIDLMEHHNIIFRSYESRRDVTPFQDICWYSEWIMAGKDMMCCHPPERVLRQYGYVQTIPSPPTMIADLDSRRCITRCDLTHTTFNTCVT